MLERFDAELLDSFEVFDQFCLVISNVIGEGGSRLLGPLGARSKWPTVHAQFFRWDDLSRLALAVASFNNTIIALGLWHVSHSLLVNRPEVFLLLLRRLGMLIRFIVACWHVGNFLDRLGNTLDLESRHVVIGRLELVVRTVHDDHLTDLVRGSQVHRRLLLVVLKASSRSVLHQ